MLYSHRMQEEHNDEKQNIAKKKIGYTVVSLLLHYRVSHRYIR